MKRLVLLLLVSFVLSACNDKVSITYGEGTKSTPVETAVNEFKTLIEQAKVGVRETNYTYRLTLNKDITDGSFGYRTKDKTIEFFAGDAMGLSNALYTLLEDLGYTFDLTGISVPETFNWAAVQEANQTITPAVRWRGIRQHVNFPMDVSSYSIEDAKKYIDCVTRLRMNKFTIHSYPGQWYETHIGDSLALAGNFFYGNKHYMYDSPLLKRFVPSNDSLFCIPKAEKLTGQARSTFATQWMKEFITYAKERGFYIQFSFEPRATSIAQAISTSKEIIQTYPNIDALELITEETGGWGKSCTEKETLASLKKYFTPEIAQNKVVVKPVRKKQRDLNNLYTQIGISAGAIKEMTAQDDINVALKLGIYCSIDGYTPSAYRLARLALPSTPICLMPSHGSDGTANSFPLSILSKEDMALTEIYSWIEFDGLMYLQQNTINGNERLLNEMNAFSDGQLGSLCYNHWRTAENRTNARYAAESTLKGAIPADTFYKSYAKRLALPSVDKYIQAMHLLNDIDTYSKSHLGNMGFCWMGAWRNGGPYNRLSADNIAYARGIHFEAANLLAELLNQTQKGTVAHDYLAFLGNRTLCTVRYLDAFQEAVKIQTLKRDKTGKLSSVEKKRAETICNKALLLLDQYLELHASMMPDRGCEGTLVSVWNSPIRGLKIFRSKLTGIPMDVMPHSDDAVDAPPLPIFYE